MPDPHPLPYLADSQAALAALLDLPHPVLLESRGADGGMDVLAAAPDAVLSGHWGPSGGVFHLDRAGHREAVSAPLQAAASLLSGRPLRNDLGLPVQGGLLGFVGYEFGLPLQSLPPRPPTPGDLPDLWLARYPWLLVTDHSTRSSWLLAETPLAADRRRNLEQRLARAAATPPRRAPQAVSNHHDFQPDLDAAAYARAFQRVQGWIRAGDCYQVNLAVRFARAWAGDDLGLYAALTADQPAAYSAFLAPTPQQRVLSVSPERFLRVQGDQVSTQPIKGTRPRHPDPAEDARLAAELAVSSKDRAENLMIVDLLRNDLGRVCATGSVAVPELFRIHHLAKVHHMVSTVTGTLAPGRSALDLLAAAFPGGSITGAPKRRAMQLIEALEPRRREVYCGSVLWLDHSGDMDASIAIRTLVRSGSELRAWGGGGLVADSREADEAAEIQAKIGSLLAQASACSTASRRAS